MEPQNQEQICPEHTEAFIAFCIDESCKKPVCVSCMPAHIGHRLLNHTSLAEHVKASVNSATLPLIETGLNECKNRIEQVETLPDTIASEMKALADLIENLRRTAVGQQEKFKESIETIKAQCEQDAAAAKSTKGKIEAQAESYQKALQEIEKYKAAKSFDGVYQTWAHIKELGDIEKLHIDQDAENQVATTVKKMQKLSENLNALISATIKKLNKLPSVQNVALTPKVEVVPPPTKISEPELLLVQPVAEHVDEGTICTACGLLKPFRAKIACGCFVCYECTHDALTQKFTENFPEPFKAPSIECKNCNKTCELSSLKLALCGCTCDTKTLKQKLPFQWNSQRSAFEWPACCANSEHKLDMEDILTLWGSAGYAHFDKDLTVDQSLKAFSVKQEISYIVVTRPFTLEQTVGLAQILKSSKSVKHLICGPKTVQGLEKTIILLEGIKANPNLQTFIIKQNTIGKSIANLSELLPTMTQLTTLDLSGNELGMDGIQVLSQGILLMENNPIRVLNLSNNELGMQGARHLAEVLPNLLNLKGLYIDNNRIGMKGAKYVAQGISSLNTLQTFSLNGNGIGAQGAKYLCGALEKTQSVKALYVQSNDIATEGAKSVADLIEKCGIRVLVLQQNRIGLDAAKKLADILEKAASIQVLNLADNFINLEGAKAIIKAAEASASMKILDLSAHKFVGEEIEDFKARMNTKGILLKIQLRQQCMHQSHNINYEPQRQ
eukprot:TRINITY_DN4085_c0_g1_i1.p2 TRINITY_DN4085_c0_g1~~TRINITY_DN4085_c0_g1_i1.p2  ORF type:complete len:727 (+),score=83.14 TRINITY_DN4085_c0_g1_i1:73-2253(+)